MMLNMSQDAFNKLVTLSLFIFFMLMYAISFITGKPIDWIGLATFVVPSINHIVNNLTASQLAVKTVDADVTKSVASSQSGGTNGSTTH